MGVTMNPINKMQWLADLKKVQDWTKRGIRQHPDVFISKIDGPIAIGRSCKLCQFHVVKRKERAGHAGRGWGMREGNKLRGQLIQHLREEHPEALIPRKADKRR